MGKPSLSFEIFPPNSMVGEERLIQTLSQLKGLSPDFISVTCSNQQANFIDTTLNVADYVQNQLKIPAIAHLPALYLTAKEVDYILEALHQRDISQILALRGDYIENKVQPNDFHYASELIDYIQGKDSRFKISGACYPETHPDSKNRVEDILNLKRKVESGCQQLITQLFFDNDTFYRFQESCALSGIEVPVLAGIMPIINRKQAIRLIQTCQTKVPRKFMAILEKYEYQPESLKEAGLAYALDQIVDLVTQDADGIHLYTMNQAEMAHYIYQATTAIFQNLSHAS
ncbi:methylenetetrahydrofolate reductase [NAD(P)H] [uncultured Enterococcus sp.]|uniref:methylenetetrahydrofolate reductase [NAD(P)H] n=1 Tax=uncultured Enterococcus sp. TaxID=167972 RepID=UPI002602FFC7|nr:methylenetetrahydrofolate reductase [NAD(P)H] [uncultured Enterococcus sp.]